MHVVQLFDSLLPCIYIEIVKPPLPEASSRFARAGGQGLRDIGFLDRKSALQLMFSFFWVL
jgi:hypothetical protein